MTTTTAAFPAAGLVHQLKFARGATKRLLEGIPVAKLSVIPPSCSKNVLWVVGHLACTDDYFLKEFAGRKSAIPEEWQQPFGMNSQAVADATHYPAYEKLIKALDERHEALVKWFNSMTEAQRAQPTAENWRPYAPTIGDLAGFIAWHEGYHTGQLSVLRRAFGLPSAFG